MPVFSPPTGFDRRSPAETINRQIGMACLTDIVFRKAKLRAPSTIWWINVLCPQFADDGNLGGKACLLLMTDDVMADWKHT